MTPGVVAQLAERLGAYSVSEGAHGAEYVFTCPFCAGGKGANKLWVNPKAKAKDGSVGTWICHREQKGGPLSYLTARLGLAEATDTPCLTDFLRNMQGLLAPRDDELPQRVDHWLVEGEDFSAPPAPITGAYRYLREKRNLSDVEIQYYGIGIGKGRYRGRVILPDYDAVGNMIYWQARSYEGREPKYLGPRGSKEYQVWGLARVKAEGYTTVYVTEGVFSAIACGCNAVATYSYGWKYGQVSRLADANFSYYVLVYDGAFYAWRQAHLLAKALTAYGIPMSRISTVFLPQGTDPADVDDLRRYLDTPVPFTGDNFVQALESYVC